MMTLKFQTLEDVSLQAALSINKQNFGLIRE